jgi:hypothetical protein
MAGNVISQVFFQEDISEVKIDGKSLPVFLAQLISELTGESFHWRYCVFGMRLVNLGLF